ncbi:1355_t:CDS:2, partial [Cetraspora pellucida]
MEESDTETQSVSGQNPTTILECFMTNEETNKAKCNYCTKEFSLLLNELIAKNHISKAHQDKWKTLEKNIGKTPSKKPKSVQNNRILSRSNIDDEDKKNDNKFNDIWTHNPKTLVIGHKHVLVQWTEENIN